MKRPTSLLNKFGNKFFLVLWIIYHLFIVAFFCISFAAVNGNMTVDADLFNMFPKPFQEQSIRQVDDKYTEITGQSVFMIAKNSDFNKAKQAAVKAYDALKGNKNFKSISLYSDYSDVSDFQNLLAKYKWNLLDEDTIASINRENGAVMYAQDALQTAFSPFTFLPLDNIDMDPFMLQETEVNYYVGELSKSVANMSVRDGVLATERNGTWYIMLRGILTPEGAALAKSENAITQIYDVCLPLETDGTSFIFSGTAFNSHKSSNDAVNEVTIISVISLTVVVLMLLIVFRSPIPVIGSLISIGISMGTAFLTTFAVFHNIHVLTMIFGTSLIGSCIDYSIHYFTHWAGDPSLKTTSEIRQKLLPGLTMAIVSSGICYIILLFAPFNILKQMSLFSVSGLISSFLTTIALYPFVRIPTKSREIKFMKVFKPSSNPDRKKKFGRYAITVLFVLSIGTILIGVHRIGIKNDVEKLYTIEGRLLHDYKEIHEVLNYTPSGWFIVRGESEQEVLEREAEVCHLIDRYSNNSLGYVSTSQYIPPIERQKRSRAACAKLLELSEYQLEALGFEPEIADEIRAEFNATEGQYITFESGVVPEEITELLSTSWIGEMNGYYYSVVMPGIIVDSYALQRLVEGMDNVFYVDKMVNMGEDLDKLTLIIFEFFGIAYILMFVMLKFFYSWKQAAKIISVPLLIILITAAVYVIFNINMEFFSVTGMILVFGLGLDYIIYMMENENNQKHENKTLEPFATMLSFITTVVSFGALALSNFVPVHLMGLSIFIGLTTAYISTMLYDRSL